jgi:GNAT superfamily N-acetyltransferase
MLFAGTALAARIEAAECRLLADSVASAARRHPATGAFATPLTGGIATFSASGSPLNQGGGAGLRRPARRGRARRGREGVRRARDTRASGAVEPRRPRHRPAPHPPRHRLHGVENVLGRSLPAGPAAPRAEGVDVAPSPLDELGLWVEVVASGFASPDTQGVPSGESYPSDLLVTVMADMAAAEGFSRFLARRGGVPAGGASLRLCEGVAHHCGAATRPAHRRRGVQTALLAARLELAGRAGGDVAVVITEPGSKSQENVQRHGFELLYSRAILVREV